MPEARLSTAGRFEDIQEATYSFIKKAGVNVYTVKINGDYFADPKWGKGFRRGSVVEAELDLLYTADQIKTIPLEEMKKGIEQRISYDEFNGWHSAPIFTTAPATWQKVWKTSSPPAPSATGNIPSPRKAIKFSVPTAVS